MCDRPHTHRSAVDRRRELVVQRVCVLGKALQRAAERRDVEECEACGKRGAEQLGMQLARRIDAAEGESQALDICHHRHSGREHRVDGQEVRLGDVKLSLQVIIAAPDSQPHGD